MKYYVTINPKRAGAGYVGHKDRKSISLNFEEFLVCGDETDDKTVKKKGKRRD
jgi:hypothetical protein